jgi:hypothetical protein
LVNSKIGRLLRTRYRTTGTPGLPSPTSQPSQLQGACSPQCVDLPKFNAYVGLIMWGCRLDTGLLMYRTASHIFKDNFPIWPRLSIGHKPMDLWSLLIYTVRIFTIDMSFI